VEGDFQVSILTGTLKEDGRTGLTVDEFRLGLVEFED
jgi:hypothetical protein